MSGRKGRDHSRHIALSGRNLLVGQTPAPLRAYSFSFDEARRTLIFKAEVDQELTEDEREDLAVTETEIDCQDVFGEETLVETTVVTVVPVGQPLDPLPGGISFLRDGEVVPAGYGGDVRYLPGGPGDDGPPSHEEYGS